MADNIQDNVTSSTSNQPATVKNSVDQSAGAQQPDQPEPGSSSSSLEPSSNSSAVSTSTSGSSRASSAASSADPLTVSSDFGIQERPSSAARSAQGVVSQARSDNSATPLLHGTETASYWDLFKAHGRLFFAIGSSLFIKTIAYFFTAGNYNKIDAENGHWLQTFQETIIPADGLPWSAQLWLPILSINEPMVSETLTEQEKLNFKAHNLAVRSKQLRSEAILAPLTAIYPLVLSYAVWFQIYRAINIGERGLDVSRAFMDSYLPYTPLALMAEYGFALLHSGAGIDPFLDTGLAVLFALTACLYSGLKTDSTTSPEQAATIYGSSLSAANIITLLATAIVLWVRYGFSFITGRLNIPAITHVASMANDDVTRQSTVLFLSEATKPYLGKYPGFLSHWIEVLKIGAPLAVIQALIFNQRLLFSVTLAKQLTDERQGFYSAAQVLGYWIYILSTAMLAISFALYPQYKKSPHNFKRLVFTNATVQVGLHLLLTSILMGARDPISDFLFSSASRQRDSFERVYDKSVVANMLQDALYGFAYPLFATLGKGTWFLAAYLFSTYVLQLGFAKAAQAAFARDPQEDLDSIYDARIAVMLLAWLMTIFYIYQYLKPECLHALLIPAELQTDIEQEGWLQWATRHARGATGRMMLAASRPFRQRQVTFNNAADELSDTRPLVDNSISASSPSQAHQEEAVIDRLDQVDADSIVDMSCVQDKLLLQASQALPPEPRPSSSYETLLNRFAITRHVPVESAKGSILTKSDKDTGATLFWRPSDLLSRMLGSWKDRDNAVVDEAAARLLVTCTSGPSATRGR